MSYNKTIWKSKDIITREKMQKIEDQLEVLSEQETSSSGSGTSDYLELENKPQINGVTLTGNKSLTDLGAAATSDVAAKYTKPGTGIPASDLSSTVQASLNKADTALQGENLTSVVNNYIETNFSNPSSPPLDRTLSSSASAAPADMVGDLKSALGDVEEEIYEEIVYTTGTATSGTTSTVTLGKALQANKTYKITIAVNGTKTTTGNVALNIDSTYTVIGTFASGAASVTFDNVSAEYAYTKVRIYYTESTDVYTVTVYETKSVIQELEAKVSEIDGLQQVVTDLGYDDDNIVTYRETDILSNMTFTSGSVSTSGTVSSSNTLSYSEKIPVKEGYVISATYNANAFRMLCAYDADDNPVSAKGESSGFATYTVPSGIASVIVTRYNTYSAYDIVLKKTETEYVTPQKPMGFFKANCDLGDGDELTTPIINVSKNIVHAFSADITSFDSLQIGKKNTSYHAYLEIDDTNITIKVNSEDDIVIPHGLTIANNISVRIIQNADGADNPTTLYRGVIELSSNGVMFKTSDIYDMPQNYWTLLYCPAFVKSVGSILTNCVMTYIPRDADKKIYMFGDSYFSYYEDRWTYYLVKDGFDKNSLINAYAGEDSKNAVTAMRNLLDLGMIPTYAVWCLGMNDGADPGIDPDDPSDAWVEGRDAFLSQCKKYGIIPVFGTIPTVPNKSNEKKNAWIRNSGYQYIDFAKAVGADSDGHWYGYGTEQNMLSTDNVHPSEYGAVALYGRVLTDFPQIGYTN